MNVLIVGASAVSGQSAVRAVKELSNDNFIISTSSRNSNTEGNTRRDVAVDLRTIDPRRRGN